ncbi:MAG TPA: hypothetical protein VFZ78_10775 [Flavisolibacter sp.]
MASLFFVTVVLVVIIPFVFFLLTQQKTLRAIQPQNRLMEPGQVWLQLIPLFGTVWQFIVVTRIAKSLQRELASASAFSFEQPENTVFENGPLPTYNIGLAYCILVVTSVIPVLGTFTGIAAFVCWIAYWIKLSGYKNQIEVQQVMSAPQMVNS